MTAPQQDGKTQIDIDELIEDFSKEIGSLRSRMIVDRKVHEAEQKKWEGEKRSYLEAIGTLGQRIEELERQMGVEATDTQEVIQRTLEVAQSAADDEPEPSLAQQIQEAPSTVGPTPAPRKKTPKKKKR